MIPTNDLARAPAWARRCVRRWSLPAALVLSSAALAGCATVPAAETGRPPSSSTPPAATGVAAEPVASAIALASFDTAWGRVARVHYDSAFNGVDWGAVRDELRPKAAGATTTGELRAVISDMLERLGESHYGLIPREVSHALETPDQTAAGGQPGDLGMDARLVDGRVLVTRVEAEGPAAAAGIRTGWALETIDGRALAQPLARLEALPAKERQIAVTRFTFSVNALLGGSAGDTALLELRDGAERVVAVRPVRQPAPGEPIRFGNLPTFFTEFDHERVALQGGGCVGVIRFSVWMLPVAAAFDRAMGDVRDCEGIIIDVRGNPGGVAGMVMGIAGHFFDTPTPLGILRQRGTELKLVANPRRVDAAGNRVEPYAGHLAVLTDEASVSTSEIFAAGLQTQGRARIFGGTTAGQALPAVASRLPNGDVLMYVIADLTGPDGRRIEGSGVAPDETVPITRAGLLAGRDAAMDAALRWIAGRPTASTIRTVPAGYAGVAHAVTHRPD